MAKKSGKKGADDSKLAAKAAKKAKAAKAAERLRDKEAKKQKGASGGGGGDGGGKRKGKGKGGKGDDEDEEDLEAVLAQFQAEWEEQHAVTEELSAGPPSRRANGTLTTCPSGNYLWQIGGDYFDGSKLYTYPDVYRFDPSKSSSAEAWRIYRSKNAPAPRSAHQVVASPIGGGRLWLFGGEFASQNQTNFHHFHLWVFDVNTHEWERIDTKLRPSARSGHRMAMFKHYIVLFGGFHDLGVRTTYLDDLWLFDTLEFKWRQIEFSPLDKRPSARSGFSFLPCAEGVVLHGGFCKTYEKGKRAKAQALDDTWMLKIDPEATTFKWEKRKKVGYAPSLRSGCTMALWANKAIGVLFGGVTDEDRDEETLESVFHKDMFGYQLSGAGRWVSLNLKKPKKKGPGGRRGKKAKAQSVAMQEEREEEDAEDGQEAEEDADKEPPVEEQQHPEEEEDEDDPLKTTPLERYNPMLAILRNTLYIYGGIFESGSREYTLDDFHSLALDKLDRFTCLRECKIEGMEWNEEDEEEDDEDDQSSSSSGEEEGEEGEGEGAEEGVEQDGEGETKPELSQAQKDDLRARATAFMGVSKDSRRSAEDALSTPLPGETLRVFYDRTREYWAGKAHELTAHRGKELRRDGFQMAEERYEAYKPLLEEIERIQAEAGLDAEEMGRGARAAGPGAGGLGTESRNRR